MNRIAARPHVGSMQRQYFKWLRYVKDVAAKLSAHLTQLENIPSDVAWKLVGSLFRQTTSMIAGAAVFVVLGIVGFVGTGSPWYLGGLAYTLAVFLWRFWQSRLYARKKESSTPIEWAWRSMRSGWAVALGWGAWSSVLVFESEKSIVMMMIGMHAGLITGGAVRNSAVPGVANGQVVLAAVPLFIACVASANPYLFIYAAIVIMHIFASLALIKFLRKQSLQLLVSERAKSDLVKRLEQANQELETLVATDGLTGVANRRAFDLIASREWRRSAREETPLSILMLDVDHFKAYNDRYGHQAGDACLQEVAAVINAAIRRPVDMLARYGGEEFAVILPGTDLDGAVETSERILAALAVRKLEHTGSAYGYITVSIGAACMIPDQIEKVEQLTGVADTALYVAKHSGRNRVHATAAQALKDVQGPDATSECTSRIPAGIV